MYTLSTDLRHINFLLIFSTPMLYLGMSLLFSANPDKEPVPPFLLKCGAGALFNFFFLGGGWGGLLETWEVKIEITLSKRVSLMLSVVIHSFN